MSILNVVIIGNGVAGISAARIIKEKKPKTRISIYSEENIHYYPRPRLYDVLSAEVQPKDVIVFSNKWYTNRGITVNLQNKAKNIDTQRRELLLKNGDKVKYDKLLLANGGHSFIPPIKGVEKTGVFTLRSVKDAITIRDYTKKTKKTIVVGGGLLGLEFAASLKKLGQEVEVVELFPRLLPRQLDNDGATVLKNRISALGIDISLGVKTKEILGREKGGFH